MMKLEVRGQADEYLNSIMKMLENYGKDHPRARIVVYRHSTVSIRIRIIDPDFAGVSRGGRHDEVWRYLEPLSEEILSQISIVLLLAPKETKSSIANMDFDSPIRSSL